MKGTHVEWTDEQRTIESAYDTRHELCCVLVHLESARAALGRAAMEANRKASEIDPVSTMVVEALRSAVHGAVIGLARHIVRSSGGEVP